MIAQKKKVMMMAQQAAPAPIPAGYVTNGLIMFLDGLQVASNSLWVDLVSGVEYTLHNAVKTANGVTFAGDSSSYGESTATFPSGVTIEAAYTLDTLSKSHGIFSQYWDGDNVNPVVMLARSTQSGGLVYSHYASRNVPLAKAAMSAAETVSAVIDNSVSTLATTALNGNEITDFYSGQVGYSAMSGSRLGARGTTASLFMDGTLCAVRIYNRALSAAEMLTNQAIDNQRYGLGITFPT